jgi:hypothetical protein
MIKKLPNVDIVVLGALYGKPLHAYDIRKLIIKLGIGKQSWGGFSLSSVYYSIKRLINKKYIEYILNHIRDTSGDGKSIPVIGAGSGADGLAEIRDRMLLGTVMNDFYRDQDFFIFFKTDENRAQESGGSRLYLHPGA